MEKQFIERLFQSHQQAPQIPSPQQVCSWLNGLLKLLFPELADRDYNNVREFEKDFQSNQLELFNILHTIEKDLPTPTEVTEAAFYERLSDVYDLIQKDADAILKGDPAAASRTEVIRTYPGFFGIAVYRLV